MFQPRKNRNVFPTLFVALFLIGSVIKAESINQLWKIYNNSENSDSTRLNAIGEITIHYLRSNPDSAIITAKLQVELAQKGTNKIELSNAFSRLGTGSYYIGNYSASIKCHTQALKIYEEIKRKSGIASAHNNIGITYFELKNHEMALKEFNASLAVYKELRDTVRIASITGNIGNVYYSMNMHKESLITNKEALYLLEHSNPDPFVIANTINNIGVAYQGLKNYKEALNYFEKSLKIRTENEDELGIEMSLINFASLLSEQKKFKEAEVHADKALKLAQKLNDLEGLKEIHFILSEIYKNTGRPEKALESYRNYVTEKDSLINEENSKQILQTQMQYDYERKEAEIRAEQEKKGCISCRGCEKKEFDFNCCCCGTITMYSVCICFLQKIANYQKAKDYY